MRIRFLTDTLAPWGEAKEGQVVDVLPSFAKRLIALRLAVSTAEAPNGTNESAEHAERTKGDGAVIVVVSPEELQAMAGAESESLQHKEQESLAESRQRRRRSRKQ
jgi:hypothetical protein